MTSKAWKEKVGQMIWSHFPTTLAEMRGLPWNYNNSFKVHDMLHALSLWRIKTTANAIISVYQLQAKWKMWQVYTHSRLNQNHAKCRTVWVGL